MNRSSHVFAAAVAVVAIAAQIEGQRRRPPFEPPPITGAQSPAEMTAALDAYLTQLAAEDKFAGVVLVARGRTQVFERAYGLADRSNNIPITTATRFNLSSLGKQFTSAAIDQLVAAGKLTRADTLGEILPDYPNEQAKIATVQQLLDHRAGIADFFGEAFDARPKSGFRSNADYFAFVAPQPLLFAPGSEERYCNGCYVVLGEVIARVSGVSYEAYLAQHVFGPAEMRSTAFASTDAILPNIAIGYTRRAPDAGGELRANTFTRGAAGSGAGGVFATAADLLAWVHAGPNVRPDTEMGDMAIAGGSPGSATAIEQREPWTVIALSNLDPPSADVAAAIMRQLAR